MFWCIGLFSVQGQSPVHHGTLFVPEEMQFLQSGQRCVQPLSCPSPVHSCSCAQHTWSRCFSPQHYQTCCLDISREAREIMRSAMWLSLSKVRPSVKQLLCLDEAHVTVYTVPVRGGVQSNHAHFRAGRGKPRPSLADWRTLTWTGQWICQSFFGKCLGYYS